MKLVIVSDLHGQLKTIKYLEEIITKEFPYGVIIPGDITSRDDTNFLDLLFDVFKKHQTKAFMICGNSDGPDCRMMIEKSGYSINLESVVVGNYHLYGISDSDEPVVPDSSQISGSILVTHKPPLAGVLNQRYSNAPRFHINGHIHSRAFIKRYPSTIHIQVPTLQDRRYAIFDPDKEDVQFLLV